MAHAAFHRALDQGARVDGIVAVIAERIAHQVGNHDRRGEMNDRVDFLLADDGRDERLIAALADDERSARCDGPIEARGQVVEHHHALAGVAQRVDHVTADIAGAAGDQESSLRSTCVSASAYADLMNTALYPDLPFTGPPRPSPAPGASRQKPRPRQFRSCSGDGRSGRPACDRDGSPVRCWPGWSPPAD